MVGVESECLTRLQIIFFILPLESGKRFVIGTADGKTGTLGINLSAHTRIVTTYMLCWSSFK